MPFTSITTRQLSDGNSQGTVLGISAADLISFYGARPISRQSTVATSTLSASSVLATATAAAISTSIAVTVWGYSSAAQANAIVTAINQIQTDMIALQGTVNAWRTAMTTTGLFAGT